MEPVVGEDDIDSRISHGLHITDHNVSLVPDCKTLRGEIGTASTAWVMSLDT